MVAIVAFGVYAMLNGADAVVLAVLRQATYKEPRSVQQAAAPKRGCGGGGGGCGVGAIVGSVLSGLLGKLPVIGSFMGPVADAMTAGMSRRDQEEASRELDRIYSAVEDLEADVDEDVDDLRASFDKVRKDMAGLAQNQTASDQKIARLEAALATFLSQQQQQQRQVK